MDPTSVDRTSASWMCVMCGTSNDASRQVCARCDSARVGGEASTQRWRSASLHEPVRWRDADDDRSHDDDRLRDDATLALDGLAIAPTREEPMVDADESGAPSVGVHRQHVVVDGVDGASGAPSTDATAAGASPVLRAQRCPNCHGLTYPDDKWCNHCGTPVAPRHRALRFSEAPRPIPWVGVAAVVAIGLVLAAALFAYVNSKQSDVIQTGSGPSTTIATAPTPPPSTPAAPTTVAATPAPPTTVAPTTAPTVAPTSAPTPAPTTAPASTAGGQVVSDPSALPSGWAVRIATAEASSPRERSDIFGLLAEVGDDYPTARVYATDDLAGRADLGAGFLVLLISGYPDRSAAQAACDAMAPAAREYGCIVQRIG